MARFAGPIPIMLNRYISAICLLSLLLTGCETLEITHSWRLSPMPATGMKRILVMGFNREADRAVMVEMERHLSDDLRARGYVAISALGEYGPHAFDHMSEPEAIRKLKQYDYDAVLTIVLLDKEKERHYVPGQVIYTPYGFYHNRFWGYRTVLVQRIYEPGYYVTDTKYFWESNLYTLREGQVLLFSAQSRSFEPDNASSFGHQYAKSIIERMVDQGVLTLLPTPLH
jgi:hypothetical protein